jgi:hypothetical protein
MVVAVDTFSAALRSNSLLHACVDVRAEHRDVQ